MEAVLGGVIFIAIIIGFVWFREYIAKRAAQDREARERHNSPHDSSS